MYFDGPKLENLFTEAHTNNVLKTVMHNKSTQFLIHHNLNVFFAKDLIYL